MSNSIEDELAMLVAAERERPGAGTEAADHVWSGVQARLDGAPPPTSVPAGTPWGLLSLVGAAVLALGVGVGWSALQPGATRFEPLPPTPAFRVAAWTPADPQLHAELPALTALQQATEPPVARSRSRENTGTVADELALIERARTSLERGRAQAALGTLGAHRRQFPKGAFLEEAAALRASALCRAGRTQAAKKASAAFLRRYPTSVHVGRVKACLGEQ